jgi:hypothetical protein
MRKASEILVPPKPLHELWHKDKNHKVPKEIWISTSYNLKYIESSASSVLGGNII